MRAPRFRPDPSPALNSPRVLSVHGRPSRRAALLGTGLLAVCLAMSGSLAAAPQEGSFQAPTRLFSAPSTSSLATLPGNQSQMRYTLGALDRAARMQIRLEDLLRYAGRWAEPGTITVYVLSREEWTTERINMPYGVPVRVGPTGLAIPAAGDQDTARMWGSLSMPLPSAPAKVFYRGGAGDAPSEVMADVLGLLLAGEILADRNNMAGDEFWVRGLVSHLASIDYFRRDEEGLMRDLDGIYSQVLQDRGGRILAASDYRPEIDISDWMWFQANFHFGAQKVFEEEGRGVWRRLSKMRKRNGGVVTAAAVLNQWEDLRTWYEASFSAISKRPAR